MSNLDGSPLSWTAEDDRMNARLRELNNEIKKHKAAYQALEQENAKLKAQVKELEGIKNK